MRRCRPYILFLLCLLVPLRSLAEPMACMGTPNGTSSHDMAVSMQDRVQMSDAHHECDPVKQGPEARSDRATHCHCVALSGWLPFVITSERHGGAVAFAQPAVGVAERIAPHIWRPPAVDTTGS